MVVDAHFSNLVLSSSVESDTAELLKVRLLVAPLHGFPPLPSAPRCVMAGLVVCLHWHQELQATAQAQVALCESIESLHGHVGHIVSNSSLPVKPLPNFSVEYLYL